MTNLLHTIQGVPKDRKIIIFDLDGTLTESKMPLDSETALLVHGLIQTHKVAVMSGASLDQMKIQLLDTLPSSTVWENLSLLPLDGGSLYCYENEKWVKIYQKEFSEEEKKKIIEAISRALKEIHYQQPEHIYGEQLEDRRGQITFSALGQRASLEEKTAWSNARPNDRVELVSKLKEYLPEMEVKEAGLTSIDITQKGIDKKFGIEQLLNHLNISKIEALFVGDDFKQTGNDFPALSSGVLCFGVDSLTDTKELISYLIS